MTLLIASWLARIVLASVFAVAGLAKLANADRTRATMEGFGVPGGITNGAAVALPVAELAIAAALIAPPTAFAGALAASALLILFTGAILLNLSRGQRPDCNCFGQIAASPIGPLTLVRNGVLTGLGILVVAAGPRAAATWRLDAVFDVPPLIALAGAGAVATIMLLLLIAAMQVTILQRLARLPAGTAPVAALDRLPGESSGLPEGSLAPSFGLSDTRGEFITLEQLLAAGRPTVLFFTKPDCPPCAAMANEVDRWQKNHAGLLEIVRVSHCLAAIEHHALLQSKGEVAQAYACWGTPCAVLITPDGRIGSPAAQGAGAIRALVRRAAAAAAQDRIKTA
jgi:uncharacterized membrane protein YphA (DoxX/SURF4 family)